MRRAGLALALLLLAPGLASAQGSVRGSLRLAIEGLRLADTGPTVVFLDGVDAPLAFQPPASVPKLHQENASFHPSFLAITAGQTVAMPNDDAIFHNVFSFSKPNDFDLGLYAAGESRSVRLVHAGLVRIYCSIHESMSATIFVAPSPWFAIADASGAFVIRGVPAGSYRLRTWNEKLPEAARTLRVSDGSEARVDLTLGAAAP